jgi:hypothetical protein
MSASSLLRSLSLLFLATTGVGVAHAECVCTIAVVRPELTFASTRDLPRPFLATDSTRADSSEAAQLADVLTDLARDLSFGIQCSRRVAADPALRARLKTHPLLLFTEDGLDLAVGDFPVRSDGDSLLRIFRALEPDTAPALYAVRLGAGRSAALARQLVRQLAPRRARLLVLAPTVKWTYDDCVHPPGVDRYEMAHQLWLAPPGRVDRSATTVLFGLYAERSDAEAALRRWRVTRGREARVVRLPLTGALLGLALR